MHFCKNIYIYLFITSLQNSPKQQTAKKVPPTVNINLSQQTVSGLIIYINGQDNELMAELKIKSPQLLDKLKQNNLLWTRMKKTQQNLVLIDLDFVWFIIDLLACKTVLNLYNIQMCESVTIYSFVVSKQQNEH